MVKFWNLATYRDVATIRCDSFIRCLFFSPDGRLLAASHRNGFRCWRAPSLAEIDAAEAKESGK